MGGGELAAAQDPLVGDHAGAVLVEGEAALGLLAVELDHPRDRGDAGQGPVQRAGAHARGSGVPAQAFQPEIEGLLGASDRRQHGRQCRSEDQTAREPS